ncbi:MAG: hypothetical protein PHQ55_08095 [Eubacteriales bacterium]|jgi:hypothetical protein|nr:hypothetical protein [Eubacteriales bacterium]MDD3197848.1 hypothetical protein [Eubacteriales bacterium]MDD3504050.1 hypothetical protein [Eubacteriales bacterium]MDD4683121.1 hypothetical protein [Eubacteriales bacterium]
MECQYYYDQIMQLYGLDEMKIVLRKWSNVSRNLKYANDMPVILPNLLWVTKPGIGKSCYIKLLAEYLSAARLMSFYGNVKSLEFALDYCPDEVDFSELRRLMRELKAATGYRGDFKGVLSVELDQWIDHFNSQHFKRLMTYLSGMDNSLCIIFVLENADQKNLSDLERVLAQYVRIDKVESSYPPVEDFLSYVIDWLSNYDFKLEDDAIGLLRTSIDFLRSSDSFDGFKTLNLMCEDIVFEICAADDFDQKRVLSSQELHDYSRDGIFINRLKEMVHKRRIGFDLEPGGIR